LPCEATDESYLSFSFSFFFFFFFFFLFFFCFLGTFGKVYRGKCRAVDVAVKVPKKRKFTPQQLEAFKKEMRIWSRLYHPNICLFMGAHVHPEKVLIVTEILEGDLESLLKKNKKVRKKWFC
jgi:serine/threonine protein kinase